MVHFLIHGRETVKPLGVNLAHQGGLAVLVVGFYWGFYRGLSGDLADVGEGDVLFGVEWVGLGMCFLQLFVCA